MNNVYTLLWILHRILDKSWKVKQASNSQIYMYLIGEVEYLSLHANEASSFTYLFVSDCKAEVEPMNLHLQELYKLIYDKMKREI